MKEEEKDDIDAMLEFLRDIVKPNMQGVKFGKLQEALQTRQKGGQSTTDFVFSLEKKLTKLKSAGIAMDGNIAAFILLTGLTSSQHRDIVMSQVKDLEYDKVRGAILGLNQIPRSKAKGYGYMADPDDDTTTQPVENGSGTESESSQESASDFSTDDEQALLAKPSHKKKKYYKKARLSTPSSSKSKKGYPRAG